MSTYTIEVEMNKPEGEYWFYMNGRKHTLNEGEGAHTLTLNTEDVPDNILRIMLLAFGFQGTKCGLSVKVDGKGPQTYPRVVDGSGKMQVVDSLILPLGNPPLPPR